VDFKETFGIKALLENLDDASPESKLFYIGVDDTLAGTKEMSEKSQNEETVSDYFTMPLADFRKSPLRESNPLKFNKSEKYKLEKVTIDWDTCIKKCNEETLIYIFFNIMDEPMQMSAVEELYKKGWRYHRKLKAWFSSCHEPGHSTNGEVMGRSSGTEFQKGAKWVYFSLSDWRVLPVSSSSFPQLAESDFVTVSEFQSSLAKPNEGKPK
jgi:NOT2 / NOT3 / NOT5 family